MALFSSSKTRSAKSCPVISRMARWARLSKLESCGKNFSHEVHLAIFLKATWVRKFSIHRDKTTFSCVACCFSQFLKNKIDKVSFTFPRFGLNDGSQRYCTRYWLVIAGFVVILCDVKRPMAHPIMLFSSYLSIRKESEKLTEICNLSWEIFLFFANRCLIGHTGLLQSAHDEADWSHRITVSALSWACKASIRQHRLYHHETNCREIRFDNPWLNRPPWCPLWSYQFRSPSEKPDCSLGGWNLVRLVRRPVRTTSRPCSR